MAAECCNEDELAITVWTSMLEGNRRFAVGKGEQTRSSKERRLSLLEGQSPKVVVLSCADSRVAPEIIFDAQLGEIFSVRSAGEILDEAVIASLEYAVEDIGVKAIIMLGHEHCGAVASVCKELKTLPEDARDEALLQSSSIIVREVGPAVLAGLEDDLDTDDMERIHVSNMLAALCERSQVIREALQQEQCLLIGARYRMSDGLVEVLSL